MVGESRAPNGIFRMSDHLGVGEGQRYPRSRVMLRCSRELTQQRSIEVTHAGNGI